MIDKFVLWILKKVYRYHRVRMERYYDMAYGCLVYGEDDMEIRYYKKYEYHNKRCARIDTLIYAIEDS